MTRVVAVIPARIGSTRLPAKPLADICGKPMIQHVYERAVKARLLNWCIVATDDERIASVVRGFGGHAVITPENLETGTDRVAFVARSLRDADILVNIQGDEPLLNPAMADETIRPLLADESLNVSTPVRVLVNEADLDNPAVVKVVLDKDGNCIYFSRSPVPHARDQAKGKWTAGHRYYKHIGLYVYRRSFLLKLTELDRTPLEMAEQLEQLRILENGERIRGVVTTHDSIPVDTPDDLVRVRAHMEAMV